MNFFFFSINQSYEIVNQEKSEKVYEPKIV